MSRTTKRKLSVKAVLEKCNPLRYMEKGISNNEVAIKYGVPKNKKSKGVKNREKYFKAKESASSKKRKLREKDFEKLDKIVFLRFALKRSQNNPLDGNLIMENAVIYIKELGCGDYQVADRWPNRWKRQQE